MWLSIDFIARGVAHSVWDRACQASEGVREYLRFTVQFVRNPTVVGSFVPSSSGLVDKIIRMVPERGPQDLSPPRRILEIGSGTGVFTEKLVQRLRPQDHLDIVEYDPEFCKILRKKFGKLRNVTIHQSCILEFQVEERYDVVISGLPLAVFDKEFVGKIVRKYEEFTQPGGWFSYFEYMLIPEIKQVAFDVLGVGGNFTAVLVHKEGFKRKAVRIEMDPVWKNITPAVAIHCQMPPVTRATS